MQNAKLLSGIFSDRLLADYIFYLSIYCDCLNVTYVQFTVYVVVNTKIYTTLVQVNTKEFFFKHIYFNTVLQLWRFNLIQFYLWLKIIFYSFDEQFKPRSYILKKFGVNHFSLDIIQYFTEFVL